jgi:hypothetical protein
MRKEGMTEGKREEKEERESEKDVIYVRLA